MSRSVGAGVAAPARAPAPAVPDTVSRAQAGNEFTSSIARIDGLERATVNGRPRDPTTPQIEFTTVTGSAEFAEAALQVVGAARHQLS
ncbi:MAG: hypothetical protein ACREUE_07940, partial [Panacagrimonas sp.]